MSLRTVEITLDRPRHLQFTLLAMRNCCRRLGGISFLTLLQRLEQFDLEALITAVHCGLTTEDRKLEVPDVERLLEAYMEREGSLSGILSAVSEAVALARILPRRGADADGNGADPTQAPS